MVVAPIGLHANGDDNGCCLETPLFLMKQMMVQVLTATCATARDNGRPGGASYGNGAEQDLEEMKKMGGLMNITDPTPRVGSHRDGVPPKVLKLGALWIF